MNHVESTTDELRNSVADALLDENGLPPTGAALDVIMAVIRETIRTDEMHGKAMGNRSRDEMGSPMPTFSRYAIDAERILRIKRKFR